MMFLGDRANQLIVLLKSGRAHPFVEGVDRVARSHGEQGETHRHSKQYAKDQFKGKSYHVGIKSRAPGRASN